MRYPEGEDNILFKKMSNTYDDTNDEYYACGSMIISKVCNQTSPCVHKVINNNNAIDMTSEQIKLLFIANGVELPEHFSKNILENHNSQILPRRNDNVPSSLKNMKYEKNHKFSDENEMLDNIIYNDALYNPADTFQNIAELVKRFNTMRDDLNKLNNCVDQTNQKLVKMVEYRNTLSDTITPNIQVEQFNNAKDNDFYDRTLAIILSFFVLIIVVNMIM